MPAAHTKHLEKRPVDKEVQGVLGKIASDLSDADFMPLSPNIEYTLKRNMLDTAKLLVEKLAVSLEGTPGCSVFRVVGSEPVPFRRSTGPATLLPFRSDTPDGGSGLRLEVGTAVDITSPVFIQPKTDFVAVYLSKQVQ